MVTNREDKTEKHFLVFLYLVFDRDLGRKKRGQDTVNSFIVLE